MYRKMLRLGRGIRIQYEKVSSSFVLLFPEGIVDLNDTAYRILSKIEKAPKTQSDLQTQLQNEFQINRLDGFDEFIDQAVRARWIEKK